MGLTPIEGAGDDEKSPPVAEAHKDRLSGRAAMRRSRWRPTHEKGSLDAVEIGRSVEPSIMLKFHLRD
jgi:hypothetical protein